MVHTEELIFYTILVTAGICHVNSVLHSQVRFTMSLFLLTFSGLCVVASIVLLLGLFFDNRLLLIPWLIVVSMTTLLDMVLSLYLITDLPVNPFVITMYVIDYILCAVNVYSILCVLSQYQEYAVGRRVLCQTNHVSIPTLSRCNGAADRSGFGRVASWPAGRLTHKLGLQVPSHASPTTNGTPEKGRTGRGFQRPLRKPEAIIPEVEAPEGSLFVQEEASSGVHISTAETSLQQTEEDGVMDREDDFQKTANVDPAQLQESLVGSSNQQRPVDEAKDSSLGREDSTLVNTTRTTRGVPNASPDR
ncbi:hypothetical protein HPB47_008343 [Ixodes persulcatus]|uniref:Uncharacterized protein n=1 Tax=Ixodes persulcatus TaxID=34615 RepID=A0AC60P503_IXOPE|nr:hypothetical protein HPB47_008343 [Ixodes persulcatus]